MIEIETFSDRDSLADAAAAALADALKFPGPTSLVAAGGSTPSATYRRLSAMDLDWSRVTVTLGDERWVDASAAESNERMIRETLLQHHAEAARFLPLKGHGAGPDDDASAIEPELRRLAPFSAVLLGMGEDGHVASLFPGNPSPAPDRWCVGVAMSGLAPFVPRITLTPLALLATRSLVLQITGPAKRTIVEQVLAGDSVDLPVAQVLRQASTPVRVLWAP
jgi:6-phosphogluconolactonase